MKLTTSGMTAVCLLLPLAAAASDSALFEPDLPQVLTPVRLQQPLAEVPASVTVITAEQMRLWGVSDIADVFRFVPGMFVAREINSNSTSVLYHSGDVVLARRLEVLVDGRSVYKASFANVDWDQLNIAPEDVERIEVTRGPSAASYGMNAFQGVINIITRHPADSPALAAVAEYGVQQRRHGYGSFSLLGEDTQQRVSVFGWREGESGDYHADRGAIGGLPDLRQVRGLNWSGAYQADADNSLRWQLGRQELQRDWLADSAYQTTSPQQDSVSDVAWLRWRSQLSADHELQLQTYWQGDNTSIDYQACAPAMAFDTGMSSLYLTNPALAEYLAAGLLALQDDSLPATEKTWIEQLYAGLAAGVVDTAQLEVLLGSPVSSTEYALAQQTVSGAVAAAALDELVCGDGELDIYEQRADIELQDTRRWNSQLRSVQGLGYRHDQVSSQTYLNGSVSNHQWLAFVNVEYRPWQAWLWSLGLMAEYESGEPVRYSPRLGLNYLFGEQQSVRVQVASSYRSPDLVERYLYGSSSLTDMSGNYLDLEQGRLFYTADADAWRDDLKDEEILAWELGYFGFFRHPALQLSVKLFQERLRHLISSQVTLKSTTLENQGDMLLRGIEGQLSWQPVRSQTLLLTWLVQDRQADADQEQLLGAESSIHLVWTRQHTGYEQALGYFLDRNSLDTSGGSAAGRYRQQKAIARLGMDSVIGHWYVATEYDALAGQVLYETTPRWLTRAGWRLGW